MGDPLHVLVIEDNLGDFHLLEESFEEQAIPAKLHLASNAVQAFSFLGREGTYASVISAIDIKFASPKYFTVGAIGPGTTSKLEDSWTLTMTRTGASSGYGAYTVTFTQDGYDATNSTIDGFPSINPIGTDPNGGTGTGGTGS